MQYFLSNKQSNKPQTSRPIPRPIPTPTQHLEFEKFATFSEGVILDELDRHRKEVEALSEMDEKKQKEIDELYQKLLEREGSIAEEKEEKKIVKVKSHFSLPNAKTGIGGLRLKTNAVSKKSSSKLPSTLSQLHSRRWL